MKHPASIFEKAKKYKWFAVNLKVENLFLSLGGNTVIKARKVYGCIDICTYVLTKNRSNNHFLELDCGEFR